MSLVVMRPDGGADLTLDLRAELRAGWTGPATWALLAVGVLLVVGAALLLLRPLRPREVIFVVEPDQVPVLAGRLGVTSLSGLGARGAGATPPLPAVRQLTPVGSGAPARTRWAIGAEPARPATLADLEEPVRLPRPPGVALSLAWPPAVAEEATAQPVRVPPARPRRWRRTKRRVALHAADVEGHPHRGIGATRATLEVDADRLPLLAATRQVCPVGAILG
ncbi:hypothetical protein [Micromonospora tarensis]|uniref:hypothetical protein n=1 Tax=Micromonospora tarensis TaxID=2806100 RepID=UPI001EE45AE7|nr:hypothetical protein [Micromonospora tarensis]